MIIALSRFGTFSGLRATHSSTTDEYPGTPTFPFYGSSYQSKYVSFVSVEETANYRQGDSASPDVPYVTLQTPTAAEQALLDKYDPGSDGNSIPFIDIGNKYVEIASLAPYGPQDLVGKSWNQVAAALRDPSTAIAQGADASANYLTAGICALTGNQPATRLHQRRAGTGTAVMTSRRPGRGPRPTVWTILLLPEIIRSLNCVIPAILLRDFV